METFISTMDNFDSYVYSTLILSLERLKVLLISSFIVWQIWKQIKYYISLPPGPWGIPYFGCLLFMKGPPQAWYLKRSAEYGDIFSVKLGNHLVVCIGSFDLLKQLFHRHDSIGRPHTPLNDLLGGYGIILSEGKLWKKQRQFLNEKLRILGVKMWPNQRFENVVHMEIGNLLKTLERCNGDPIDPAMIIGRHMHNVICQLMMSFRFEDNDDEKFKMFTEIVTRGMELYGSIHFGEYVKQYLKLPGKHAVLQEIKRNHKDISKFHADYIRNRIALRKSTIVSHEPADILDYYLDVIENEEEFGNNDPSIFEGTDPEKQIVQVMNDLFSAGMETSRTAILWCFVMMLREPDVADQVREQINRTVQVGHQVTLNHRSAMPYVEAVIFETLRLVSIVPLGTTHVNTGTWIVGDYTIPAGTHIIPLMNKMSIDPEVYPEPHIFRPERFIKDGKFQVTEKFAQFGVGQRMCLGARLARIELFLFFANIMNNFEFTLPEGREMPGLEGILGTTHAPVPFDLCFQKLQ